MATKNFKVRNGLDIGDNISITDAGTATGITTIASASNSNITIAPDGTGDVLLTADTVQIGDNSQPATLTTNGTGNLVINTNNGTNAGSITLANGTNGAITLAPNGTGNVAVSATNGSNLTNTRNYLLGSVRDATTLAAGNIWALQSTISPTRGISLSNSDAPSSYRPGVVLRSYSNASGTEARSWMVFEHARGTVASPAAIQNNDRFCEIMFEGHNGTSWSSDVVLGQPFLIRGSATETWSASPSRAGTKFEVLCQPAGVNYTASTPMNIINHQPTAAIYRADTWDFRTRTAAAGGTNISQLSIDSSGNLTAAGNVTATGNINVNGGTINGPSGGILNIVCTDHGNITNPNFTHFNKSSSNSAGVSIHPSGQYDNTESLIFAETHTTDGTQSSRTSYNTYRTTDGINYTPTQNGDNLGKFFFNGNAYSSTNPGVPGAPGASIVATANENWTSSANGTIFNFFAIKNGTINSINVMSLTPTDLTFRADTVNFNNSTNTNMLTMTTSGATLTPELTIANSNGHGGSGYAGMMTFTNTTSGSTNQNKYIRLNNTGSLEIINSAYTANIFNLTDAGELVTPVLQADSMMRMPVKTSSALTAITGQVGWMCAVSNNGGRMAFWDTANSRWSYVHDNSAV